MLSLSTDFITNSSTEVIVVILPNKKTVQRLKKMLIHSPIDWEKEMSKLCEKFGLSNGTKTQIFHWFRKHGADELFKLLFEELDQTIENHEKSYDVRAYVEGNESTGFDKPESYWLYLILSKLKERANDDNIIIETYRV
jgi:hypothetical protein